MSTRFLRPVYLVWVVVPLILYGAYLIYGLPHFCWSYSWRNNGTHDPFAYRYYTRCTYIGPYGSFTIRHPANGECEWFRFFKSRSGRGLVQRDLGNNVAALQPKYSAQFNSRKVLQNDQDGLRIRLTGSDLPITMVTRLECQIIGHKLVPEFLVAHRLKPFFELLDVFENGHALIVPKPHAQVQI